MILDILRRNTFKGALIAVSLGLGLASCSEKIDESDLYTFTGEMMVDHFENNPETFSSYLEVLGQVHPSKRSKSTMKELLDARGHYTCFAPTNKAIDEYLDSMLTIGKVSSKDLSQLPDSVAEDIVFNSIIDNNIEEAYASTDFQPGALQRTNMNGRYVDISYSNDSVTGVSLIYVNTNSLIIDKDIEVENGYIHTIDKVLSPSTATIADLVENTPNTQIFGMLLKATGWDEKLLGYKDEEYEEGDYAGTAANDGRFSGYYPETRNTGYTIYVETDSIFNMYGITDVESLKKYLQDNGYYSDANFDDDYSNEDNAVNQFVSYHLLPEQLTWNRMVIFSNEKGFFNGTPNDGTQFQTNVWEYYETMGKQRRSLKVTGIRGGKRLNRCSVYNLISYREIGADPEGIKINQTNGKYKNSAMNGYYYTIEDLLLWSDVVAYKVLNERMRYDICSLLPKMITNNCRYNKSNNWFFTKDYFDNIINVTDETSLVYLPNQNYEGGASAGGGSWTNYQTDEFNIGGIYDFTMKLPPVPYTGTYEIRYGVNANGNRGMAQIYIGTNPNNLPAVGIPIDLRLTGTSFGWVSDTELDADGIEENDKAMRNNDYMKGPNYFYPGDGQAGRVSSICLRRIIYRGQLEAGKTYYVRFKSVLESKSTEFFYDYLEFVPRSVYNGDVAEDKW